MFVIFLIFYMGIMVGNLLIIVTIKYSRTLENPMYFFLFFLSFADVCFSTSTAPQLIVDALSAKKIISYNKGMTQIFALHLFGCMDIFVLIFMAVDQYLAICRPLCYPIIMRWQVCTILIILACIRSFIHSIAQTILALRLPFCGSNLVDHYCCNLQPLLKLACMDTYVISLLLVSNIGALCLSSLMLLIISYIIILYSLRNNSAEGMKKALSNCTTYISIVILSFGPSTFMYTCPPITFSLDKMLAVFYTIGTPFLNPLIYTLRHGEVNNVIKKLWSLKITSEIKGWPENLIAY